MAPQASNDDINNHSNLSSHRRNKDQNHAVINIDISIGTGHGLSAIRTVRGFMRDLPHLRPIALIVKSMLKQSHLNDVATGGLGSYVLVNMITAYLKTQQPRSESDDVKDLGMMLKGFLRYFSKVFDHNTTTISVTRGGFCEKLKTDDVHDNSWRNHYKKKNSQR